MPTARRKGVKLTGGMDMRKLVLCSMMFAAIVAMAYVGCGGTGGNTPTDAGFDSGVKPDDGGTDSDGSYTCKVTNTQVGIPCEDDNACSSIKWREYEGVCLNYSFCATMICSDEEKASGECAKKCDIPQGYCFMLAMQDMSGGCGAGAHWVNASAIDPGITAALCVKCCNTDNDCRKDEMYWCWKDDQGIGACVPDAFRKILPANDAGM